MPYQGHLTLSLGIVLVLGLSSSSLASNVDVAQRLFSDKKLTAVPLIRPPMALAGLHSETLNEEEQKHPFVEGQAYIRIPDNVLNNSQIKAFKAKDPGKVQVIEFFNYGCFWCSRLYPQMAQWESTKSDEVAYYRYPIVLNRQWEALAKLFYTVRALGFGDSLDTRIFEALHHHRMDLSNPAIAADFLAKEGVDKAQFLKKYADASIEQKVKAGNKLSLDYRISASPVVVVNTPTEGSFWCLRSNVQTEGRFIQLIRYVIDRYGSSPGASDKAVDEDTEGTIS